VDTKTTQLTLQSTAFLSIWANANILLLQRIKSKKHCPFQPLVCMNGDCYWPLLTQSKEIFCFRHCKWREVKFCCPSITCNAARAFSTQRAYMTRFSKSSVRMSTIISQVGSRRINHINHIPISLPRAIRYLCISNKWRIRAERRDAPP
jgi:hypothetical protein